MTSAPAQSLPSMSQSDDNGMEEPDLAQLDAALTESMNDPRPDLEFCGFDNHGEPIFQ